MSSDNWPWDELELDGETTDKREIKKAYARKLKNIDQVNDVETFTKLREAYDYALSVCDEALEQDEYYHDTLVPPEDVSFEENAIIPSKENTEDVSTEEADTSSILGGLEAHLDNGAEKKSTASFDRKLDSYEDDWDYLNSLTDKLEELVKEGEENYAVDVWREIIEDPAVMSFESRKFLEERVLHVMVKATSHGASITQPVTSEKITPEFVQLLDNHFNWVSDGVSFVKHYGSDAEWVLQALTISRLRFSEEKSGYRGDVLVQTYEPMPFLLRWYVVLGIYIMYRLIVMS